MGMYAQSLRSESNWDIKNSYNTINNIQKREYLDINKHLAYLEGLYIHQLSSGTTGQAISRR